MLFVLWTLYCAVLKDVCRLKFMQLVRAAGWNKSGRTAKKIKHTNDEERSIDADRLTLLCTSERDVDVLLTHSPLWLKPFYKSDCSAHWDAQQNITAGGIRAILIMLFVCTPRNRGGCARRFLSVTRVWALCRCACSSSGCQEFKVTPGLLWYQKEAGGSLWKASA